MAPAILATFIETLREEHARMTTEANGASLVNSRTRATLERRIANLVDALADGDRSPSLRSKLADFENQLEQLRREEAPAAPRIAPIPADPAALYRAGIAELEAAIADQASPDLRGQARAYIRRLEVHPPSEDGGPPRIVLEGHLPQMLRLAGLGATPKGDSGGLNCWTR